VQVWHSLIDRKRIPAILSWSVLCVAIFGSIYLCGHIYASPDGGVRRVFFLLSGFVLCAAFVLVLKPLDREARLVCYSLFTIAFFVIVFLWKLYDIYLSSGIARAMWGRYFFPLIPVMLLAAFVPLLRWLRAPSWAPIIFAVGFALAEMATLLGQVMPLWKNL